MQHASQTAVRHATAERFSTKETNPEGQGTVLSVPHVAAPYNVSNGLWCRRARRRKAQPLHFFCEFIDRETTIFMKTKNIITASILLVVAILIGSLVATYFSYNNREIALRQQAEAQRGKIEGVHDKMWKIIQQKAQVTDEYKQTFEKIYPQLIAGRYQNDQGTMMKWIKESNPNFDVSLYRDLMQAIEIQRTEFQTSQERMLDIIREHETLTRTYPARWFVSNTMPIEYKVISSSRSKEVMTEGEDNDVDLFDKKQ